MRVTVRLFASLREVVGCSEIALELPASATAEGAWGRIVGDYPALGPRRASLAVAVNRRYAGFDTALHDGDELAFIPPVSGG